MQLEHLSIDGRRKLLFRGLHAGAGLAGGDGNAACDGTHG